MSACASPADSTFKRSYEHFEQAVVDLSNETTAAMTHAELEERVTQHVRTIAQSFIQDHFDLRALRESPQPGVVAADEVERTRVEAGRTRKLVTVHGQATITRLAYRERDEPDLQVADAIANLPEEKYSHGMRRLVAIESVRGSFDGARDAIERTTGQRVSKRQLLSLTQRAAQDVEDFYDQSKGAKASPGDVMVLSMDGKGVVMRPDGLRETTAKAAEKSEAKLTTRISPGEKSNRKRMAEVGAVYTVTPVVRSPADIIGDGEVRSPGPVCKDKWLTASLFHDTPEVINMVFSEAQSRDPKYRCQWIALVDGNTQQIACINAQADERKIDVVILIDIIHVLEYLWKAAWSFFLKGNPDAEVWVGDQAIAVLEGKATAVAAGIRRKATANKLTAAKRTGADTCADYLCAKAEYLNYPLALSSGWPIATGIIEGACRHLVKDRMDLTGARWGLDGAEAILKLRATICNGNFDEYWKFHLEREHDRVHRSRFLDGRIPGETDQAA